MSFFIFHTTNDKDDEDRRCAASPTRPKLTDQPFCMSTFIETNQDFAEVVFAKEQVLDDVTLRESQSSSASNSPTSVVPKPKKIRIGKGWKKIKKALAFQKTANDKLQTTPPHVAPSLTLNVEQSWYGGALPAVLTSKGEAEQLAARLEKEMAILDEVNRSLDQIKVRASKPSVVHRSFFSYLSSASKEPVSVSSPSPSPSAYVVSIVLDQETDPSHVMYRVDVRPSSSPSSLPSSPSSSPSPLYRFARFRELHKLLSSSADLSLSGLSAAQNPFPKSYACSSLGRSLRPDQLERRLAALNSWVARLVAASHLLPRGTAALVATFLCPLGREEHDAAKLVQRRFRASRRGE